MHSIRSTAPWVALAILTCVALVCRVESRAPKRVAIRVECNAACSFVESLAVDVWSEHRGPGLPLDVVVRDDTLAQLAAVGVTWQVLVPDIDAAAREEAMRLRNAAVAQPGDWFAEYRDYRAITTHLQRARRARAGAGIGAAARQLARWPHDLGVAHRRRKRDADVDQRHATRARVDLGDGHDVRR